MALVRLDALAQAGAEEASALLSATDATALVAAVREMSDDDLQALVDRDEIRSAAITALVGRLQDFAIESQLEGIEGSARIELTHRHDVTREVVRVAGGAIRRVPDSGGAVDVALGSDVLTFVRLATGQRNAGLEYLGGRLSIEGDAGLAMALASIFPAPGPHGGTPVPVDPRALDPVDVARELGGVDTDHLRRVMASGFRPVVLDEVFSRLPAYVSQRKARGLRVVIGFRLTGRPDGEVDRYVVRLEGGRGTVLRGADADAVAHEVRSATVTCGAHDFLRLATGHLSPVTGVLRGQLKVRGDKAAALRLAGAFDIPSAAAH